MTRLANGTQSQAKPLVEIKTIYRILFRQVDQDVPFENWLIGAGTVEEARDKLMEKLKELSWIDHSKTKKGQFEAQVSIFSVEVGNQMDLTIVPSDLKLIV